eukprot:m.51222 g.51222  ORF g.51222 m.51222 type:complete len:351 (-) comp48258_c0_seq1:192-1244(-)
MASRLLVVFVLNLVAYASGGWILANLGKSCDFACSAVSSRCHQASMQAVHSKDTFALVLHTLGLSGVCKVHYESKLPYGLLVNKRSRDCYFDATATECSAVPLGTFLRVCCCSPQGCSLPASTRAPSTLPPEPATQSPPLSSRSFTTTSTTNLRDSGGEVVHTRDKRSYVGCQQSVIGEYERRSLQGMLRDGRQTLRPLSTACDDYSLERFKNVVSNKGQILVVIKHLETNVVFGAYIEDVFKGIDEWLPSNEENFIFRLTKQPIKATLAASEKQGLQMHVSRYGLVLGQSEFMAFTNNHGEGLVNLRSFTSIGALWNGAVSSTSLTGFPTSTGVKFSTLNSIAEIYQCS